MRHLKVFYGILAQLGGTLFALTLAAVLAYTQYETVHFQGSLITLGAVFFVGMLWYVFWFIAKERQTRDMDMSHYKGWGVHLAASFLIGLVPASVLSFVMLGIMSYSVWVFFVSLGIGSIVQLGCLFVSYVFVRPR